MRERRQEMAENKKKTAVKKKKKMTPFLKLVCFVAIAVSGVLLFEVGKEVYTTITLKEQLAEVQEKLQEVQDENAKLTSDRAKLEDPDYVASYARGTYLLSKGDEQIFYLPESTESAESTSGSGN